MVASASFAEFLREQLAPLGHVTLRRMFGKTGVFCDGLMFGMVTDNTLYFRVDDRNRAAFQEAASFPPLSYKKKGSMTAAQEVCMSPQEIAASRARASGCPIRVPDVGSGISCGGP
jgi:TfoX/Sxy family transcriptional regulator of competence genes